MGCTSPQPPVLNSSNLPSSFIRLDAAKPYQLKTAKGAIIRIAANSFDVPAGSTLQLEIKEAYTMQDILLGGLTTMSNGKALQSGGMIYFNATSEGKLVKFLKEVSITIPAAAYNPAMQLFKGEIQSDSTINWIDPTPLDTSPVAKRLLIGEQVFKANCANCHRPTVDYTGPALAMARLRAPFYSWSAYFTNNVNSMLETDVYAKRLLAKYGGRMTQFNLTNEDVNAILDYADNVAELIQPGTLARIANYSYPLEDTADYIQRIVDSAAAFQRTQEQDCGYDTIQVYNRISMLNDSCLPIPQDSIAYVNGNFKALPTYAFTIRNSGWYNIDCFIQQNKDSVQPVQLTATLDQQVDAPLTVYLSIPSKKLLTQGFVNDKGKIIFDEAGGKISLIVGADAYVFATGGKGKDYFYSITPFTISTQQALVIHLKKDSKDAIIMAFKKNSLEGVIFDANNPVLEDIIVPTTPAISSPEKADSNSGNLELEILKRPCPGTTAAVSAM